MKSEVAALERSIQLTLTPPEQAGKEGTEQVQEVKTVSLAKEDAGQISKDHLIIARPKPLTQDTTKGFKL